MLFFFCSRDYSALRPHCFALSVKKHAQHKCALNTDSTLSQPFKGCFGFQYDCDGTVFYAATGITSNNSHSCFTMVGIMGTRKTPTNKTKCMPVTYWKLHTIRVLHFQNIGECFTCTSFYFLVSYTSDFAASHALAVFLVIKIFTCSSERK